MKSEILPFKGWEKNLRICNESVELIVTLDVGPRIISYKTPQGFNMFGHLTEQLGQTGEDIYRIRGGHRLWVAPEIPEVTYDVDNFPVDHKETSEGFVFSSHQTSPLRLKKTLRVQLHPTDTGVRIDHLITNEGDHPATLASWGLTIMAAEGMEIIPQPAPLAHALGYLPNRGIALWPYTDLSDPRWTFRRHFFFLQHTSDPEPTKIGLSHQQGWTAYLLNDQLFIKRIAHEVNATYPDGGCNFETYTDARILEIESLSPLKTLQPGESVGHSEQWFLFDKISPIEITSEEALQEWLDPFIQQAMSPCTL